MPIIPPINKIEAISVFIPENDPNTAPCPIKEEPGHYYSLPKLLRKYAHNPNIIKYLADMAE